MCLLTPFAGFVWAPDVEPDVCLEQRGRVGWCRVSTLANIWTLQTSTSQPLEEIPLMSLPIHKTLLPGEHGLDGAALLALIRRLSETNLTARLFLF